MLVGYLTISAFVGLNPQVPVASQTIIDTFLGLMIGIVIATVVGRLIWPVLPQRVLQDNLLTPFAQIKALLSGDPHREEIQTQLAILPVPRSVSRHLRYRSRLPSYAMTGPSLEDQLSRDYSAFRTASPISRVPTR